jgi:hypothetical protein
LKNYFLIHGGIDKFYFGKIWNSWDYWSWSPFFGTLDRDCGVGLADIVGKKIDFEFDFGLAFFRVSLYI